MCQVLDAVVRAKNAGILVVCRGFLQVAQRKDLVQIAGENCSSWETPSDDRPLIFGDRGGHRLARDLSDRIKA